MQQPAMSHNDTPVLRFFRNLTPHQWLIAMSICKKLFGQKVYTVWHTAICNATLINDHMRWRGGKDKGGSMCMVERGRATCTKAGTGVRKD